MAKYVFQLLAGEHTQVDADGVVRTYSSKNKVDPNGRPHPYNGRMVESDVDLAAKLGRNKFMLVGGGATVEASPWQLDPFVRRPGEPDDGYKARLQELIARGQQALGVAVDVGVPQAPPPEPVSPTKLAAEKAALQGHEKGKKETAKA